jgi:hypothetical protein
MKAEYETRDVAPRPVILSGIGLLVGTAICSLLVIGLLTLLPASERPAKPPLETVSQEPPPPRLEIDGRVNLTAVESAATAKLTGYAWVDRSAGIARIPIARAMDIVARQGWAKP